MHAQPWLAPLLGLTGQLSVMPAEAGPVMLRQLVQDAMGHQVGIARDIAASDQRVHSGRSPGRGCGSSSVSGVRAGGVRAYAPPEPSSPWRRERKAAGPA